MHRRRYSLKHLIAMLFAGISLSLSAQQTYIDTVSYRVHFPVGISILENNFDNNAAVLSDLDVFLTHLKSDTARTVAGVKLWGSASPEGPAALNERLVRERAAALRAYIAHFLELDNPTMAYTIPENIRDLQQKAQREDVSVQALYPELRFAQVDFIVDIRVWPEYVTEHVVVVERATEEDTVVFVEEPEEVLPPVVLPVESYRHGFYLKTNAIGWGMLVPNLAAEIDVDPHWSISVPVYWSALNYFTSTIKFRTFTVQPEVRYWFSRDDGWYVGAHFGLGYFNYALNGDFRIQDHKGHHPAIGGGISTGYRFNLSSNRRWKMELTLGAGCYTGRYDKFINHINGPMVEEYVKKTFIGIDNAAVNFIYCFDLK